MCVLGRCLADFMWLSTTICFRDRSPFRLAMAALPATEVGKAEQSVASWICGARCGPTAVLYVVLPK